MSFSGVPDLVSLIQISEVSSQRLMPLSFQSSERAWQSFAGPSVQPLLNQPGLLVVVVDVKIA